MSDPLWKETKAKELDKVGATLGKYKKVYDALSIEQKGQLYNIVEAQKIEFALQDIDIEYRKSHVRYTEIDSYRLARDAKAYEAAKPDLIIPRYEEVKKEAQQYSKTDKDYPFHKKVAGQSFDGFADSKAHGALFHVLETITGEQLWWQFKLGKELSLESAASSALEYLKGHPDRVQDKLNELHRHVPRVEPARSTIVSPDVSQHIDIITAAQLAEIRQTMKMPDREGLPPLGGGRGRDVA